MNIKPLDNRIVFSPGDIDPDFRPFEKDTGKETFIQDTYNPGMTRLKNGNILLIIIVAGHLEKPVEKTIFFHQEWILKRKDMFWMHFLEKL